MELNKVNQENAVQKQYKTSDNLTRRISIHEKYSTNKQGFGNWVHSHYDFGEGSRILELGCGTGVMWKGKLPGQGENLTLVLSDFSENMVADAKALLGERDNVSYRVVNIEDAVPCAGFGQGTFGSQACDGAGRLFLLCYIWGKRDFAFYCRSAKGIWRGGYDE